MKSGWVESGGVGGEKRADQLGEGVEVRSQTKGGVGVGGRGRKEEVKGWDFVDIMGWPW